ncbi:hypothetical protein RND81_14G111200 [Saponaria officinalis]|uniref:MULE transposase domain-containing protein n=1 Tax=Saponaria officinalis TaxID=3572 RepID=A0AAW1GNJ0_SAPOF
MDVETARHTKGATVKPYVSLGNGRRNLMSHHGMDVDYQRLAMEFGGDEVDYNPLFATKQRFSTRGKAFEWAQNIAFENGFALVIANSGHKNRNKKQLVLWNIVTANGFGCHNHHPTKYKDGHRHYAGLNEEEKSYVRQQYRASVLPRDIKSGLHQKTSGKPQPSSSQIYTETSKIRKEIRRERNTVQQMLAFAVEANYVHWHEINPDTHELTHVFMPHPEAVKLFRAYPHVVLIDSTYKTETYNMALVEVVGVTPAGSSFLIACVLIPSESEEGYTWLLRKLMDILECTEASPSVFVTERELGLLRALRTLFPDTPHLLCRWHMNRAIESRALLTHKTHAKKFVLCYTNDYFHLGNTATFRVESAHSLLKAWMKSVHLTLDTMWSRIHSMLEAKLERASEPDEAFGNETSSGLVPGIHKNNGSRVHLSDIHSFWRTLEYDNEEAMPKNDNDMLEELVDKARQSDPVYRNVFLEKLRDILHPEDDDILAPAVRENPKGRQRGSTTRNKSSFDHSMRKYGTPNTDASANIQQMVGDFAAGVAGAPLEKNYTKGLISTWVKRYGVPEDLWPHFDGWVDVGSDGHYGFRVLSNTLRGGEEDYIQMRDW